MRRTPVVLLIFSFPMWSQFGELAATDDGRQLYFSSALTLAEMPASRSESRIYRIVPEGIQLFAEREPSPPGPFPSVTFGSNDGAAKPQVSGDGLIVGLTLHNVCLSQDPCTRFGDRAQLRGARDEVLGEGSLQMSRNAQWALLLPPLSGRISFDPATGIPSGSQSPTLINLVTGERTAIPAPPLDTFAIASDGTVVVLATPGGLGLWRQGRFSPLTFHTPESIQASAAVQIWSISDNARVLLYKIVGFSPVAPEAYLMARDLATGRDVTLYTSPPNPLIKPIVQPMGLSNDGRWALFRLWEQFGTDGPAFIVNTATGDAQPIPLPEGELADNGTLSGSGNAAFLVTGAGRIVRIGLADGLPTTVETLVPATPYLFNPPPFSSGSLVRLKGSLPRSVDQLNGHILIGGRPMPVLFATRDSIGVQTPWELRNTEAPFTLDLPGDSPFRQNQSVFVASIAPEFEPPEPGESGILGIKAVRADFSGPLTTTPQPGEIFHVYMTGLGPVRGQVQTGVPAPLDSLRPLENNLRCRWFSNTSDAETLFAGLAPGLTGVYQVTFRTPAEPSPGRPAAVNCRITSQSGNDVAAFGRIGGIIP